MDPCAVRRSPRRLSTVCVVTVRTTAWFPPTWRWSLDPRWWGPRWRPWRPCWTSNSKISWWRFWLRSTERCSAVLLASVSAAAAGGSEESLLTRLFFLSCQIFGCGPEDSSAPPVPPPRITPRKRQPITISKRPARVFQALSHDHFQQLAESNCQRPSSSQLSSSLNKPFFTLLLVVH